MNGNGSSAQFNEPEGLTLDSQGNIYVADQFNYVIRKITPDGQVSTYGIGYELLDDIQSMGNIRGVVMKSDGTLYFSDNHRIRSISQDGTITNIVGNHTHNFYVGSQQNTRFMDAWGLTTDASGNIYIAVYNNNNIVKLETNYTTILVAGGWGHSQDGSEDGTGSAARFDNPKGVAIDSEGNLYVTDTGNHTIRKITPSGVVTTFAGSGTAGFADGSGSSAQFNAPNGIAIDSQDNIYVSDGFNNCIRKITTQVVVTTVAGTGVSGYTDGDGASARFNEPAGIAVDAFGNLYVSDQLNQRIRKITFGTVARTQHTTPTFTLYPNPASGHFTVQATQPGSYTLRMMNAQGQVVQQATFVGTQHTVPTTGLAAGVYAVQLQGPQGNGVQRVVVR